MDDPALPHHQAHGADRADVLRRVAVEHHAVPAAHPRPSEPTWSPKPIARAATEVAAISAYASEGPAAASDALGDPGDPLARAIGPEEVDVLDLVEATIRRVGDAVQFGQPSNARSRRPGCPGIGGPGSKRPGQVLIRAPDGSYGGRRYGVAANRSVAISSS
jgi:hypothetical protein